jgi:Co/Zn/Cd efflux system component
VAEEKLLNEIFGNTRGIHDSYLFGFLGLIYDGETELQSLKAKMRTLFISSTHQAVVEDEDLEDLLHFAKEKELIACVTDGFIELTPVGTEIFELGYQNIQFRSHFMHRMISEKSMMLVSLICLSLLSALKIYTGLTLPSKGMLSDGIDNLTDVMKIGIIYLGIRYNKDRFASFIIIGIMLIGGGSMVWSGVSSLLIPEQISPTIQSFIIGFTSILINWILTYFKGIVGRINANVSILSDSRDSEFNVYISAGVITGLVFAIFKFDFVDAIVGIVIAIFILKNALDIFRELVKKPEEFDITRLKVKADAFYDNRLTYYFIASVRRTRVTPDELLSQFEQGLAIGRKYYQGYADFFYDALGIEIARKHLDHLIGGELLKVSIEGQLFVTHRGLQYFYHEKSIEFREREQKVKTEHRKFPLRGLQCILFIITVIFLAIYAPLINQLLASL